MEQRADGRQKAALVDKPTAAAGEFVHLLNVGATYKIVLAVTQMSVTEMPEFEYVISVCIYTGLLISYPVCSTIHDVSIVPLVGAQPQPLSLSVVSAHPSVQYPSTVLIECSWTPAAHNIDSLKNVSQGGAFVPLLLTLNASMKTSGQPAVPVQLQRRVLVRMYEAVRQSSDFCLL